MAHGERTSRTDDQRIKGVTPLPPPEHLIRFFPIAGTPVEAQIGATRDSIRRMMQREDDRLLVVMGPCSSTTRWPRWSTRRKLKAERDRFAGKLEIVMACISKSRAQRSAGKASSTTRTSTGRSHQQGAASGRQLCSRSGLGMPAASEFLDMISPQFIADLVAWARSARAPPRARCTASWRRASRRRWLEETGTDGDVRHRDRCDPGGSAPASLPLGAQERPGRDRRDAQQHRLPRHPARRKGPANYDAASIAAACQRNRGREAAVRADDRLQPCQQRQGSRPAKGRRRATSRRGCAAGSRCIFGVMVESQVENRARKLKRRARRSGADWSTARASPTPVSAGTIRRAVLRFAQRCGAGAPPAHRRSGPARARQSASRASFSLCQ